MFNGSRTLVWLAFFCCVVNVPLGFAQSESLRLATWNVQWLADDILTDAQARQCEHEASVNKSDMNLRPTEVCRKGAPFRRADTYELMAIHAKLINADIVALQEVQGVKAVRYLFDGLLPDAGSKKYIEQGGYEIGVYGKGGWQRTALAIRKSILAPGQQVKFSDYDALGVPLVRDKRGAIEAQVPLKNGTTLYVLSVHLKAHCTTSSLATIGKDCQELAMQAPAMEAWIKSRNDANQAFIIMGDFNRVLSAPVERCSHDNISCRQNAFGAWLDKNSLDEAPVIIPTANLHHLPGCFEPVYGDLAIEQIVFGGGAEKNFVSGSVRSEQYIDNKTQTPIIDRDRLKSTLSDHCVVSAKWTEE